jgi:hypothetical protein
MARTTGQPNPEMEGIYQEDQKPSSAISEVNDILLGVV